MNAKMLEGRYLSLQEDLPERYALLLKDLTASREKYPVDVPTSIQDRVCNTLFPHFLHPSISLCWPAELCHD